MTVNIDIQIASTAASIPSNEQFTEWTLTCLDNKEISVCIPPSFNGKQPLELSIRIVDQEESQALNRDYRQKDKPTNVLSFPTDLPEYVDTQLLGDLVICAPVVNQEANEQSKNPQDHWAHMVIHGTLHLLGYDHIDEEEAQIMEALEIQLLQQLGCSSPYADDFLS